MNSRILTNINSFIKNRLIESLSILLIFTSIFLLAAIISYSPSDPNFIYHPENADIKNIGGFYGSVISDFFLQSLGLISILLACSLLFWGLKLFAEKPNAVLIPAFRKHAFIRCFFSQIYALKVECHGIIISFVKMAAVVNNSVPVYINKILS